MKKLTSVYFLPLQQKLSCYYEADGFRNSTDIPMAEVAPSDLVAINAALAWMGSSLPDGVDVVQDVIVEISGQVMTPTIPSTFVRNILSAAISGKGDAGGRTITIQSEAAPSPIRNGLLALWAKFEASLNT